MNLLELSWPVQTSIGMALPLNRLYILDSRVSLFILLISVHYFVPLLYERSSRNTICPEPILKQVINMGNNVTVLHFRAVTACNCRFLKVLLLIKSTLNPLRLPNIVLEIT